MAAFTASAEGTSSALLTKDSIFPNFSIYKYIHVSLTVNFAYGIRVHIYII